MRRRQPRRVKLTGPPWVELVAELLQGAPTLPNAHCRGNAAVFDGQTADDIAAAMGLCQRCSDLQPCREWGAPDTESPSPSGRHSGHIPAGAECETPSAKGGFDTIYDIAVTFARLRNTNRIESTKAGNMNNLVPVAIVAGEVGVDTDTLATRLADAVTLDAALIRCIPATIAADLIADHRAAAAEQNRKIAKRREAARQQPHQTRERVKALRRQQEKWTHVTDVPASGRMRADDIEASMDASSRRMNEMLGGELVVHPVRQDADR